MQKPKRKIVKLATIQAKADAAMSVYIRLKAADADGMIVCVSCGHRHHWRDVDAGHFIPKSRGASIRWCESNVHAECRFCNRYNDGHLIGYTLSMMDMYGKDKIDELKALSRKVLSPTEKRKLAEEAYSYYTEAVKAL